MSAFLWIFLVGLLIAGGMLIQIVRRGLVMKQLLADGVDAEAKVISRQRFHRQGSSRHYLRYEYRDAAGISHQQRSAVTGDTWQAHAEGAVFAIVYSRSRPQQSMPRALVEQARAAMPRR
jgi:hypothetical protein